MLKNQKYGVEIELTGITRANAANVIANLFNTTARYEGGSYKTYTTTDQQGRTWKIMRDSSIQPEPYGDDYKVEVVSPILEYNDIETIQEVLRTLRENGAKANSSCGIHIHIDGANHTATSLKNILNLMCNRQNLIYEALEVKANRLHYCKKVCPELLKKVKAVKNLDKTSIENLWYSKANHNYEGYDNNNHYNQTRYQCLNLHSYFYRGTVEFRLFNSTTHAGELKAYIQFCLAVSAWAVNSTDKIVFKNIDTYTATQKATIMNGVLTERLGLIGEEFKTARLHLMKHLQEKAKATA